MSWKKTRERVAHGRISKSASKNATSLSLSLTVSLSLRFSSGMKRKKKKKKKRKSSSDRRARVEDPLRRVNRRDARSEERERTPVDLIEFARRECDAIGLHVRRVLPE